MDETEEKHLKDILEETRRRLNLKYRKGSAEHGGHLQDMTAYQLIDNSIDECLDNIVYLLTLRDKIVRERDEQNGRSNATDPL